MSTKAKTGEREAAGESNVASTRRAMLLCAGTCGAVHAKRAATGSVASSLELPTRAPRCCVRSGCSGALDGTLGTLAGAGLLRQGSSAVTKRGSTVELIKLHLEGYFRSGSPPEDWEGRLASWGMMVNRKNGKRPQKELFGFQFLTAESRVWRHCVFYLP